MKFFRPELLFFIWLLPLLGLVALWGFRRRRRILAAFAADSLRTIIAPSRGGGGYALRVILVFAAMLLGVFALSGPRYGYRWEEVHRRGVDLVIALDCSRSMTATDIAPTRLQRAKRKIVDLLNMLAGDRVGMVAFAGTAFVQCPLTLDYSSFHLFLSALTPDTLPVGGTDLARAVQTALSAFDTESDTDKAVVLITDGENTGPDDPLAAAEKARSAGVRLFCIGVGKPDGAPIPRTGGFQKDSTGRIVMSRLDAATLKKMAALTDGAFVRSVSGDMDLQSLYQGQIRQKMKRSELQGGRRKVWEDRYQWFLAPAAVLLVLELFLPALGRRRGSRVGAALLCMACAAFPHGAEAGWINRPLHQGMDAYGQGDYSQALKSFIDAQLLDPDRPEIDYDIGNAHYRLGEYDDAARSFEAAARAQDETLRQKALYNLGNALFRTGDFKGAVERYQAALKLDPEDADARNNLEAAQKKLAQQEQQPPPSQNRQGDGETRESGEQKKPEPSGDGKPPKKDSENGRQPSPRNGAGQQNPSPTDPAGDKGEKGQGAGAPPEPLPDNTGTRKTDDAKNGGEAKSPSRVRAEQALNRLEDRPGRALMPSYGSRAVDKDW